MARSYSGLTVGGGDVGFGGTAGAVGVAGTGVGAGLGADTGGADPAAPGGAVSQSAVSGNSWMHSANAAHASHEVRNRIVRHAFHREPEPIKP